MAVLGGSTGPGVRADDVAPSASSYQWMNDRYGKPLAAWVPGKGWVAGQNWSHWDGEGEKAIGSRSNMIEQTNDYYKTGRDAQIAKTGGYVLGSVGGTNDPYSRTFDPTGVDTAGLTDLQKQMFDPTSTWGSAGYNSWGSGTDPSVGRPSAEYRKIPFAGDEADSFGMNTLKTAFGFDEAGTGVGAGTILAMWLAAGAAAGAGSAGSASINTGAAGAMGGAEVGSLSGLGGWGYGGALGTGTSALGGVEGAASLGGSATGAGGSVQPSWFDSFSNMFNGSGTGTNQIPTQTGNIDPSRLTDLWQQANEQPWGVNQRTGGSMDFDFSGGDFDWSSFGDGTSSGIDWKPSMPSAVPETTQQLTDWGMKEISPGNWAMPGEVAGTLYEPLVQKFGEQAAKSLLSQLMSGNASASDYAKVLGQLAATGLGMYGANQQSNSMNELAQRYEGYGAPYRAMLEQSYRDPNSFLANSPDIQASVNQGTNALARSLSRQGNPTGSGAALHELQNYATQGLYGQLGNERNRLANFGGMSNFNSAAPGLAGQAIGAQGNALNALGSGISSITNPPTTLEQALNALNGMQGLKVNTGMGI